MEPNPTPGALTIDPVAHTVHLDGQPVRLTKTEFRLLAFMSEHPQQAVSSQDLLHEVWDTAWADDLRVLHVHMSRLRHKLGESHERPRHLHTVNGFGYRFEYGADLGARTAAVDLTEPPAGPVAYPGVTYAVMSPDRTLLQVGGNVDQLLGWKPHELEGTSLFDLARPEDLPPLASARASLNAGNAASFLMHLRAKSGEYRQVDAFVRPVVNDAGSLCAVIAEWRPSGGNVSRAACQPVEPGDPVFERPLNAGEVAALGRHVIHLEFDGQLVLRSLTTRDEFLGWHPVEILGTHFSPAGLDTAATHALISAMVVAGTHTLRGPVLARTKHGEQLVVDVETKLLMDASGTFAGMLSTVRLP